MKRLVYCLFLLLMPNFTQAQDAAPWPPDPVAIFAPGVEVARIDADIPYLDNVNRLVYVYDQTKDQWHSYPYPDETLGIEVMWDYGRSDHLLAARSKDLTEDAWLFDRKTGSFQPYPYLCKETVVGDLWAFFIDVDGRTYLCNTQDRTLSSSLPTNVHFGDLPFGLRPTASPDRKWVFFYGRDGKNGRIHFLVYDVDAEQIIELGSDEAREIVKGILWFDNNHVVITSGDMPSWGSTAYYFADLTQPNSLTFFKAVANDYFMGLTGDPAHYEWLDDGCKLVKFFPVTNKLQEYSLDPRSCTRGLMTDAKSDDRLYEIVNYDENNLPVSVTLSRYNPFTKKQADLFTGEIESVMEVSPDGRYVELVLDHNGIVDMKLDTDVDVYSKLNIDILPSPTLAVLDLDTQKIIYEVDTAWDWTPDYWYYWFDTDTGKLWNTAIGDRGGPLSNIVGLGNDLFVKKHLPYGCSASCPDTLINLHYGLVSEIDMTGSIEAYFPNSQQLLIRDPEHTYMIYGLADGTMKPLFKPDFSHDYRFHIEKVVGGDSLVIMFENIHYTVRIPQAES